jgi:cytochrome c
MSRRLVLTIMVISALATTAIAKSYIPKANTRAAVKSYVKFAASVVEQKGPSCDKFKGKDWMSGDYYIFVVGPDDKIICHPNESLVGKLNKDVVDVNGKKLGLEIVENAGKKGGGWTDYVWPRPGTTTSVPKSTYSMKVKGPDGKWYVVGGGGYELK